MKQLILGFALTLTFCVTSIRAQKINLVGTTWKVSECICYGGDNQWFDGGTITFLSNGRTDDSDQRWKLIGNAVKVTTTDQYGREFTAKIIGNKMSGVLYEGMNKRATQFRAELTGSSNSRQTMLSARGFFCGQSEPGWVNVHLQVGNSVQVFSTSPDAGPKKRGFSKPFYQLPIGTELIIKYKIEESYGSRGNWIYEAIATGRRNRTVRRCVSD